MKRSDKIIVSLLVLFLVVLFVLLYAGIGFQPRSAGTGIRGNIAVIPIEGLIYDPDKTVHEIKDYADQGSIRALVIRLNSPGGVVAASQELYLELKRIRDQGKPVLASIASTGASGAYYVALSGSRIMANPGSITGSIGVVVSFPEMRKLFEKLGIDQRVVKSGQYKDIGSPFRTFSKQDSLRFQEVVDDLYDQFIEAILAERPIPKKDLLKIADGRILTGRQALSYGLIDTLGTLEDAISLAGKLAGIKGKPQPVYTRQKRLSLWDLLFSDIRNVLSTIKPIPSWEYLLK